MNIRSSIFLVITILVMGIIFCFSHQPSTVSKETSGRIETIVKAAIDKIEWIQAETKQEMKDNVSFVVRKTAHFTIYTVLGISLMCFLTSLHKTYGIRTLWLIAIGIGMVYAMTDEFHQTFIPGRSGELRDVALDTAGVLLGASIIFVSIKIKGIRKTRRKNI